MARKPRKGTVALFHVSPGRNGASILDSGLLISKCRSARKGIWLFHESMFAWAFKHVAEHQKCKRWQLSIYSVHVPLSQLRKIRKGIYLCGVDVPIEDVHLIG